MVSISRWSDILSRLTQSGADSVLNFGSGDTLTLKKVLEASLVSGDFLFTTAIESDGVTKLVQISDTYDLGAIGGSSTVQLKYGGAVVTADGAFAGWTPIGAEALSGGGFEVIWKITGADQYAYWKIDSSGNYVSSLPVTSGNSSVIEAAEMQFHQDLNSDGTVGPGAASASPASDAAPILRPEGWHV
jgi:hypothetical protein